MVSATLRDRARATGLGLLLDRFAGEPPAEMHPVAAFGRLMQRVEGSIYADARVPGLWYAGTGAVLGYLAGRACPPSIAVGTVVAGRELRSAAARVRDALVAHDVDRARDHVTALVGRDPERLGERELAAAVIESLAENTVDAVVAPVWWALVAGAGAAATYRAVNTMDAMVGHRSARYERFGWASARLDDLANYVPARVTAALASLVRPARARHVARAVRDHAPEHPSPNAGVAEAAFAAVLGVELGGPLRYAGRLEERPRLGWGPRPTSSDIDRALVLASHVELALLGLVACVFVASRPR
jgi:adenosylcobinamide-phosphate synthase